MGRSMGRDSVPKEIQNLRPPGAMVKKARKWVLHMSALIDQVQNRLAIFWIFTDLKNQMVLFKANLSGIADRSAAISWATSSDHGQMDEKAGREDEFLKQRRGIYTLSRGCTDGYLCG